VHTKGSQLFDSLMNWIELFINFVRDGLLPPDSTTSLSLDYLLPHAGNERQELLAEVDSLVEYHRKLKVAHHERMRRRLVRGEATDKDGDAAFVEGVLQNLQLSDDMTAEIGDLTAQDSDEEADEEDEEVFEDAASGSSSSRPASTDSSSKRSPFDPVDKPPPLPPKHSANGLQPAPYKKKKKDRVVIDPPDLVHVPKLVPVFVELVRPALDATRRSTVPPPPLGPVPT